MTESELRAKSAKKIRTAVALLFLSSVTASFLAVLPENNGILSPLGQIFQILSLIISPVLILRALSLEVKRTARFNKKYLGFATVLRVYFTVIVVFSIFYSLLVRLHSSSAAVSDSTAFSVIISALGILGCFFSYYSFVAVLSGWLAYCACGSRPLIIMSVITSAEGSSVFLLKLLSSLSSAFGNDFGINLIEKIIDKKTIMGMLSAALYLTAFFMLTLAVHVFRKKAKNETETYMKPNLIKHQHNKGSFAPDKKKLFGMDEDEYIPKPTPETDEEAGSDSDVSDS